MATIPARFSLIAERARAAASSLLPSARAKTPDDRSSSTPSRPTEGPVAAELETLEAMKKLLMRPLESATPEALPGIRRRETIS